MPDSSFRSTPGVLAKAPNPYDLVPYESYPFPKSDIRHLHMTGRLFGLAPRDFEDCRVLELGGASGGNLIPMAFRHPGSRFLGIDLSTRQTEAGQRQIAELGLKNIELRAMSILDVDADLGSFDYIIAHGVYSWVPPEVRAKILSVCRENLATGGIALVSYNTLPGWSAWQSLREAIRHHCQGLEEPAELLRQARRLLGALRQAGAGDKSPYSESLRREIDKMLELSDWFLLHDHLEEDNTPFYVHELIERVREAGLDYLGEADLAAMNLGALPAGATEGLVMGQDIARQLQFLDLLQNRRFRMSLLCRPEEKVNRNFPAARLWEFHWSSALRPEAPIGNTGAALARPLAFLGPLGELRLRTTDPLSGAAFAVLCQPRPAARPEDLITEAMQRFGINDRQGLSQALERLAPGLVMSNAIDLHSGAETWVPGVSERPALSRLARFQARQSSWVTNQRHEAIGVDPAAREIMRLVDGRQSRRAIIEAARGLADRGRLNIQRDGRPVEDRTTRARLVEQLVDQVLAFLAANALLIA